MAPSIRMQRVASLLQQVLGDMLVHDLSGVLGNTLTTVTTVAVSADLGHATFYISCLPETAQEAVLHTLIQHKKAIRRRLGYQMGKKLHTIPTLHFRKDDSVSKAAKIHQLLAEIAVPD